MGVGGGSFLYASPLFFYTVSMTIFFLYYRHYDYNASTWIAEINFIFCQNVAYLATALAEGVITKLHSVHGELPVALPAQNGHELVLKTDATRR